LDRIIYTWKTTDINHFKGFTERGIEVMKLSVQSANKFYKTELFCDSEGARLMKINEIPFKKITVVDWLDNFKIQNWGLAKLKTMEQQTTPYIHIDLDVVVLEKFKKTNYDITWGYYEVDLSRFPEGVSSKLEYSSLDYHLNNYVNNAKKYEPSKLNDFDFGRVTNNSVMIVNNPYPIKDIIQELFDMTSKYNIEFNTTKNMFMEQFLFYQLVSSKGHISKNIYTKELYSNLNIKTYREDNNFFNQFLQRAYFHWDSFNKLDEKEYNDIYKLLLNKTKSVF